MTEPRTSQGAGMTPEERRAHTFGTVANALTAEYNRGRNDVLNDLIVAYGPDLHDSDRRMIESVRESGWKALPSVIEQRVGGIPCFGHEDFAAGTWTFHREGECP